MDVKKSIPIFSPKQAFAECLSEKTDPTKKNCLLGCSGSVATLKIPELAVTMMKQNYNVLIVCSGKAKFFLDKAADYNREAWTEFMEMGGFDMLFQDADEWSMWDKIGNVVLHIELRKWADVFVVAPASASLLGKASVGISDNLVLNVMRAWDFSKPCYICPAMNTMMWEHPSTLETLNKLKQWGWKVIDPVDKVLACMDVGVGAMASVASIVEVILSSPVTSCSTPGTMEVAPAPVPSPVLPDNKLPESVPEVLPGPSQTPSPAPMPAPERTVHLDIQSGMSFSHALMIGFGAGLGFGAIMFALLAVRMAMDPDPSPVVNV